MIWKLTGTTRAHLELFFFLSFFLRHKRRFEMLYIERKMADASLGFFFFIFFPPPPRSGEKKGWRLPSGFRVPMLLLPEKKKCGEGGRKRWKSNTWKNQWKKCPSYVVLKQNQKKNWFKEIKHTRMFILLNKPLNKETGWHLTTASQKNKFSILFFFFILPFFFYDCGCIRGAF